MAEWAHTVFGTPLPRALLREREVSGRAPDITTVSLEWLRRCAQP